MRKKGFDCVAMKQKLQREVYKKIKNLTPEREMEYLRNSVEKNPLAKKIRRMQMLQEKILKKAS